MVRKKTIKKSTRKRANKKDGAKFLAFIATFFSIIGFVIALLLKRDDKYVMFYARQSLILFIVIIIIVLLNDLFELIPIIGSLIKLLLDFVIIVLWVLSWIYALSGEMKEVPFIGQYADKIKL